jgi:hypothetical protein
MRLTEWARKTLSQIWGPGLVEFVDYDDGSHVQAFRPSFFMIQCLIEGKRQVQQRGEYHAS